MTLTETSGISSLPCGVILAAGISSRMSDFKLLLPYKNKPILQHVIDAVRASKLEKTIAVLGHNHEMLLKRIDFAGVETVFNPDFKKGQSSSLKAGLSKTPACCSSAMFLLGDQPLISSVIIDSLANSYQQSGAKIVLPTYQGRRGNPVIMSRALFPELDRLTGDIGGRGLMQKYQTSIIEVKINDAAVTQDIDTDSDYQRLIGKVGDS